MKVAIIEENNQALVALHKKIMKSIVIIKYVWPSIYFFGGICLSILVFVISFPFSRSQYLVWQKDLMFSFGLIGFSVCLFLLVEKIISFLNLARRMKQ
jgi:pilus assembly protein TadC